MTAVAVEQLVGHIGPIAYPPEAVLNDVQVAAWLQISTKTLEQLPIKYAKIGYRTKRYLARHVLEYLERIAT